MAQNHFIRGVVAAVLGMTLAGGANLGFADEVKIGCGGPLLLPGLPGARWYKSVEHSYPC